MHKIGIYIDDLQKLLVIETHAALQFELCDSKGNRLIMGNKLHQPSTSVSIARLAKGTYTLKLHVEGQQMHKTIEL